MTLKDATHDKHKEAERMLFNVKMFKGELTKEQYAKYLLSQLEIFSAIEENFQMPHEGLKRKYAVIEDLKSLKNWKNVLLQTKRKNLIPF